MQKVLKNVSTLQTSVKMFSTYNYSHSAHPKVWMDVSKDGDNKGRLVFELYASHSPALAENFAAFCNGSAANQQSFAGSSFS